MSHFFAVVLVPADTVDIEEKVSELLAPYNEELEIEPYEKNVGASIPWRVRRRRKLPIKLAVH